MNESALHVIDERTFELTGQLVFSSVGRLYKKDIKSFKKSLDKLRGETISLDLNKVTNSDSSGIALLIEIARLVKESNNQLNVLKIPDQMLALAKLSSVDDLLE